MNDNSSSMISFGLDVADKPASASAFAVKLEAHGPSSMSELTLISLNLIVKCLILVSSHAYYQVFYRVVFMFYEPCGRK